MFFVFENFNICTDNLISVKAGHGTMVANNHYIYRQGSKHIHHLCTLSSAFFWVFFLDFFFLVSIGEDDDLCSIPFFADFFSSDFGLDFVVFFLLGFWAGDGGLPGRGGDEREEDGRGVRATAGVDGGLAAAAAGGGGAAPPPSLEEEEEEEEFGVLEFWREEIGDFFGLWGLTLPLSTSSRTALIGETANSAGFPCNHGEYATPIICNASGASGKSSREVKTAPDTNNPTLPTPPNNASFANPSFPTCFFASCNASDTVIFPYFFFAACKASFICCRLPWPNICAAASNPFLLCRVS